MGPEPLLESNVDGVGWGGWPGQVEAAKIKSGTDTIEACHFLIKEWKEQAEYTYGITMS